MSEAPSYPHSQNSHSELSSSMNSSTLEYYRLTRKDEQRLDNIYDQLSKGLLKLRSKKVDFLEKYEGVVNRRGMVEHEIKAI